MRRIEYTTKALGHHPRKAEPVPEGLINFASNDYLGLATDRLLGEPLAKAERLGSGASRLLGGSDAETARLEAEFAAFVGYKSALLFASGFQANMTILATLTAEAGSVVYADIHCHASINLGLRLAGGRVRRFRHNDLEHLESMLKGEKRRPRFIVTETIFSMDGDCPDLEKLEDLAAKYSAFLYLDDCHGFAVLGKNGRGLAAGRGELVLSGLGKGGGLWGAVASFKDEGLKEFLINKCGGVIYSTAPSPILTMLIKRLLQLLPGLEDRRRRIAELSSRLRRDLAATPKAVFKGEAHIIPLLLGADAKAMRISARLKESGFYAPAIRRPTVARNAARLRISLTARHSARQVTSLARAIKEELANRAKDE